MHKIRRFTVVFILSGMSTFIHGQSAATGATVPNLVNFTGTLKDSGGRPIQSVTGVTFSLYAQQQGGVPLWLETQNVQSDTNGNYTVELGATKPQGLPQDLFTAGVARWLGIRIDGGEEEPRVMLLSVPYALKAGDAETVGGLPPSAFALAAPTNSSVSTEIASEKAMGSTMPMAAAKSPATGNTAVTTAGGTSGKIPVWDSTSDITSSVMSQSTIASVPRISVNGTLALPNNGTATKTTGKKSRPLTLTASAYNSTTAGAVNQVFQWQTEPVHNNTSTPSGTLNLLFGSGSSTPIETGLNIASNGLINFAAGQTFPGTGPGTITGVTAGTDLTGGGKSGAVTLNVDITKVPQLSATNTFTGNQTVNGNLSATGVVTGSSYQIGSNLFAFGSYANANAFLGFGGNTTTTGSFNVASGYQSLFSDTVGTNNVANGYRALYTSSAGYFNVASGSAALYSNTTGSDNVASGFEALFYNTEGNYNEASGFEALYSNTKGTYNQASGYSALFSNTTGTNNVADGPNALYASTTGSDNTAVGAGALLLNSQGALNTAVGGGTLTQSTGSSNIAIGYLAGYNLTSGDNNIYIGNPAPLSGVESNTIRIGNGDQGGHTAVFLAGTLGYTVPNGTELYIGTNAQLGTITSSRRYKDDIQDMSNASDQLMKLRPVTFRYKQPAPDGSKPLQYGLIAEEVADVYPDAVLYNDEGEPNSVQYHKINAMLLNEVQKQRREIDELKSSVEALKSMLAKDARR